MERAKVTLQDIYNEIGNYLNEKGNKEVLSIATHCNVSDNTLFSFSLGELSTDTMTETDTIRVKKSLETKNCSKASNDPSFKKGDYVFMTEQADNCVFQIGKIIGEIWGSKPNSSYFMVVFNDGRVEEIPMDKMNEVARVIGKTDSDNITSENKENVLLKEEVSANKENDDKKFGLTTIDIRLLLICKGFYNKEKYNNVYDALVSYIQTLSNDINIIITKEIVNYNLGFLVKEIIAHEPKFIAYIIDIDTPSKIHYKEVFDDIMYNKMLKIIQKFNKDIITNTPEYQKILEDIKTGKEEFVSFTDK